MADVMEERIHSIERTAGVSFALSAIVLSIALVLHPVFPDVNKTNQVLQAITSANGEMWMQLHAIMAAGFILATVGFCAFAFSLHLNGSSGSASIVSACALLGGSIWVTFLCAELYAYRFFANLYSVDPGGATMLFSAVWLWKMGAVLAGGALFFLAVTFAGFAGAKRDLIPVWLGWGGALFGILGTLIYAMEFWSSTATGGATQPMQWPAVRYGVGLPLQLWMLGVGGILLQRYFTRPRRRAPVVVRRTPEPVVRRAPEPAPAERPAAPRIPHPALAPDPEPAAGRPPAPRIPHPALAPEPEEEEAPRRPKPPQIYPG